MYFVYNNIIISKIINLNYMYFFNKIVFLNLLNIKNSI